MLSNSPSDALALSTKITQLYFRMIAPMIGAMAIWSTWLNPPHAYHIVLPFCLPMMLFGLFYPVLPAHFEWIVRLVLSSLHIVFIAVLVFLGDALHVVPNAQAVDIILLIGPMTSLAWAFVFSDHPQVGRVLTTLLSFSSALLVKHWGGVIHGSEGSVWLILLLTCLLAASFGWSVNRLQNRAIQTEHTARIDALTGLHNRRAFEELRVDEESSGVLAILDIDHFKRVNDLEGHPAGDHVLRHVSLVLLDHAPHGAGAFRWGGEEFVLLLPGHDLESSLKLLEAVRAEIASRKFFGRRQITLSGGLSPFGPDTMLHVAFKRADTALLRAKREGRNRLNVWTDLAVPEELHNDLSV